MSLWCHFSAGQKSNTVHIYQLTQQLNCNEQESLPPNPIQKSQILTSCVNFQFALMVKLQQVKQTFVGCQSCCGTETTQRLPLNTYIYYIYTCICDFSLSDVPHLRMFHTNLIFRIWTRKQIQQTHSFRFFGVCDVPMMSFYCSSDLK